MKRIKSIDTFRGWCMFMMVLGHMLSWWVIPEDHWLTQILHSILGDIVGTGFIFFSGLSTVLYFRSRITKAEASDITSIKQVNNEYLFRALLILILAFLYSSATAVGTLNPLQIWKWYIPFTIAISLFLAFLLLRTSKSFRIILAVIIWISHYFIRSILLPYEEQINIFGAIYHVLYNGLHPILYYFSFFLVGTVVGDVMLKIFLEDDQKERRSALLHKFLIPSLTMGTILTLIAVIFLFPLFLTHQTFSSTLYSLGVILVSFSVLLILEEFEVIKNKKSYRFFYFYSYYSFTIYFSHNIIYFIFLNQLNALTFWIGAIGSFILLSLLIRFMYKKYGPKVSLKVLVGKYALILARKVEEKRKERIELLKIKD
ncbi:MAG: heparan-alpha-glucosaminide N-acetyltransferase domain-containing protein [Candidatus Hodarchaeota archaeon]